VSEIFVPVVKALPTTESPKYSMAMHCAADERGGLIKKRKRKKESSWVKLKVFRPTARAT